jgi:hypothetical protein
MEQNKSGRSNESVMRVRRPLNLDAHENEPTCAQFSGATECAGMTRCDMREQGRKRNALQI